MKRFGMVTLVLTVSLMACSTPDDVVSSPQLGTQFGTADDDRGVDIATISTGRIYGLSTQKNVYYEDEYASDPNTEGTLLLRRFDSSGKTIWTREVDTYSRSCSSYPCAGDQLVAQSVVADSQGNVSVLARDDFWDGDSSGEDVVSIRKYSASGAFLRELYFSADYIPSADFSVDNSGAFYVGLSEVDGGYYGDNEYYELTTSQYVAKYASNGTSQWLRTSTVGDPTDIVVTTSGSVYVAGTKGLARYTTSGNLVWTRAIGPLENVIISGSNIYTRYRKDIRKFDSNGKQLWLRTQSGLNTLINQDMAGDGSGNVYISGKYNVGPGNYSPFVRKLNSSGTVLWTKTYGTPAYDDALGIATITGSEIYVTGETQGSLSHTNVGGRDGYLRKLNSSGNPVWTR